MTASYPSSTPTLLGLYQAKNNVLVELTSSVTDADTTIGLVDTSILPNSGYLSFIDTNEVVFYTGKTATTITGVTRGADGTTAVAHASGVFMEMRWNADYHNRQNEEIISIATDLRDAFSAAPDDTVVPADVAGDIKDRLDMYSTRLKEIISGSGDWKDAVTVPLNTLKLTVDGKVSKSGDTITGAYTLTGSILMQNQSAISFRDVGSLRTMSISAPTAYSASYAMTWPAAQGAIHTLLRNDGSGNLVWLLITDSNIASGASIAYSKLSLGNSIVNGDINASAAIAYSKLNLASSIVDADINASAAIALTKLATVTGDRVLISTGGGVISASNVTTTELNYLTGVTSAIQTQLNGKLNDTGDTITGNLVFSANTVNAVFTDSGVNTVSISAPTTITSPYSLKWPTAQASGTQFLQNDGAGNLTWASPAGSGTVNTGTQFQLAYYAANGTAVSGLTLITASRALVSDANGLPVASTVTTTELGYVSGVTSAIQTQINARALDSAVVHNTGTENIQGAKTFLSSMAISGVTEPTLDLLQTTDSIAVRSRATLAGFGPYIGTDSNHDYTIVANNIAGVILDASDGSSAAIRGTTGATDAATGFVGELIEAKSGSATLFPATTVFGDANSITLSAGDWDINFSVSAENNGATWSRADIGISTTSGNSAAGLVLGENRHLFNFANSSTTPLFVALNVVKYRVKLSGGTTFYGKVRADYTAGSPQYYYRLSARRIR